MTSITTKDDLWSLVQGTPSIDSSKLLAAIQQQAREANPDFRTRLLLRDSYRALERRWGSEQLSARIAPDLRESLAVAVSEDLGEPGFPSLEKRLMEHTDAQTILEFLRELGTNLNQPIRLDIGGAGSLILGGYLSRATEDIDIVDQVPSAIRADHALLAKLASRYGLLLTHFQSHFLPLGWQDRLHSLGKFGDLEVYLVDVLDIFVGKLFSNREKDRDDLRTLKRSLEKFEIASRLSTCGKTLAAEPQLRTHAEKNWYILFGEPLPK